jgi:hypothetical protein
MLTTVGRDLRCSSFAQVHALRWVPMRDAIVGLQRSIGAGEPPTDAWQAAQFARLGITRRDPMSVRDGRRPRRIVRLRSEL